RAERAGDHLRAEADAQHRPPGVDGAADATDFGRDPGKIIVGRHRPTHDDKCQIRQGIRRIPGVEISHLERFSAHRLADPADILKRDVAYDRYAHAQTEDSEKSGNAKIRVPAGRYVVIGTRYAVDQAVDIVEPRRLVAES